MFYTVLTPGNAFLGERNFLFPRGSTRQRAACPRQSELNGNWLTGHTLGLLVKNKMPGRLVVRDSIQDSTLSGDRDRTRSDDPQLFNDLFALSANTLKNSLTNQETLGLYKRLL